MTHDNVSDRGPATVLSCAADVRPVHLHDAQAVQGPPARQEVLKDISLSFYPGAKIGVLGYNGAGKSTLLRIMAGLDKEYRGEAALAPGRDRRPARAGAQPRRAKDVRGNVEEGVAETRALLDRFNELAANYSDETRRRVRRRPGADRRRRRLEPRHAARARDGRAALPAARRRGRARSPAASAAASRSAACCCASPTCCCSTSPPTTSTPSRSRWLERHLAEYKGTVVAVTHDRYFLDNVAGWILELDRGRGIPYEGNYSGWLEQKQARLAAGGALRAGPPAHDRRRARVGAHQPQGPPHQVQGAPRQLRAAARPGAQRQARPGPDPHPRRPAARRPRDRGRPTCARASATGC